VPNPRYLTFFVAVALAAAASPSDVVIYSAKQIQQMMRQLAQKQSRFASLDLARHGTHYSLLAYRNATGSSELHEHETDIFIVESGSATLVTGGQIVHPHTTKPGEVRGSSISGGQRRQIGQGDIVEIPAQTPHQLLIQNGGSFSYFVVKVIGR